MSGKQIFDGSGFSVPDVAIIAPVGAVGLDFAVAAFYETSRWRKILLTITISVAASDVTLWMRRAAGSTGNVSDDVWGKFQDMFGVIKLGLIGTAIPVGTYHFIVPDVGGFVGLYVQKSAGTVAATVLPIQEGKP